MNIFTMLFGSLLAGYLIWAIVEIIRLIKQSFRKPKWFKTIVPECKHEWEEFGGPSNSRIEHKVFFCKKCNVMGFANEKEV